MPQGSLVGTLLQRRVRKGLGLSQALDKCQPPSASRAYWTCTDWVRPKGLCEVRKRQSRLFRRRVVASGSPSRAYDMQSALWRNYCVGYY